MALKRLANYVEKKDAAARQPYGVRVQPSSVLRTTGGTNWNERSGLTTPAGGPGSRFLHMNTDQFMEHLGPPSEQEPGGMSDLPRNL